MPRVSPMLWYIDQAEEAANLYVSLFPNSKITSLSRYSENMPGKAGSVMVVEFELDGQAFSALNGGPHDSFNDAISLVIDCKDQAEVDHYWEGLIANGGKAVQCGWLKDPFGVSWQVTPRRLIELMTGPDKAANQRVAAAMMKMVKIDIAELERAAKG